MNTPLQSDKQVPRHRIIHIPLHKLLNKPQIHKQMFHLTLNNQINKNTQKIISIITIILIFTLLQSIFLIKFFNTFQNLFTNCNQYLQHLNRLLTIPKPLQHLQTLLIRHPKPLLLLPNPYTILLQFQLYLFLFLSLPLSNFLHLFQLNTTNFIALLLLLIKTFFYFLLLLL